MCQASTQERQQILARVDEWAGEGLRLIGLASRSGGRLEDHNGYTWAGLIGMEDPVRDGVLESVQLAQRAGIRVCMITGDYRRTAERIGRSIGLFREGDVLLDGEELGRIDEAQLMEQAARVAVFARIRPHDKLRIVRALQARQDVTAMVGDGVNDAPALKRANIGVVVGSATDVAKETADLVLLDDNFRTIVAAIEEGRTIFQNIRKVVAYTLSNSFAEVLTIFAAMMLGWPTPLTVAQILWIHLICDGPSDIVLAFEPKEAGIMDEPPKPKDAPILTRLGLSLIGVISVVSAALALAIFGHFFTIHHNAVEGRSLVFASLAVNSMVYIFAYRSMRRPLFRMVPLRENRALVVTILAGLGTALIAFAIPGLRSLLGIVPLTALQWGVVAGIAIFLLLTVEAAKFIAHRLPGHE
jgi:Ca2+-transporting ATPase